MSGHAGAALRTYIPQVKGQVKLRKLKRRYVGSVRFFKQVITSVVCVMMVAPWIVVLYMAADNEARHAETVFLTNKLAMAQNEQQSLADQWKETGEKQALEQEEMQGRLRQMEIRLKAAETLFDYTPAYGYLHPELHVEGPGEYIDSPKAVYLTFDDGPGGSTRAVLEILRRYDIKATFFIVGYTIKGREAALRQIAEEGHYIGIHSYSHVYREIYSSVEAFMDDFAAASDKIEEIAGVKPDIFRFPGGSVNSYNETWGNTIISEMLSRGYRYYDWNVGSGDTAADADAGMIYEAVIKQVHSNSYSVVLMHDGGGNRSQTVQALPLIIDRLLREGYHFDRLTNQVKPTVFAAASLSRG